MMPMPIVLKNVGSTLIEVLLSFLIVTTAVYGYVFSEQHALKQSISLSNRLYAAEIVEGMIDKMHANGPSARSGAYAPKSLDKNTNLSNVNCTSGCSSAQLLNQDLYWFNEQLKQKLASVYQASIAFNAANQTYTLQVNWDENDLINDVNSLNCTASATNACYQQVVRICRESSNASVCE